MAEQEKKAGTTLSEDAWKKAMSSWRKETEDTDFDELDTPLSAELVEELHRLLRRKEN